MILGLVAAEHAGVIVDAVLFYDHPLLPGPSQPPALGVISSPDQSETSELLSTNHSSPGHNTLSLDQSGASIVAISTNESPPGPGQPGVVVLLPGVDHVLLLAARHVGAVPPAIIHQSQIPMWSCDLLSTNESSPAHQVEVTLGVRVAGPLPQVTAAVAVTVLASTTDIVTFRSL